MHVDRIVKCIATVIKPGTRWFLEIAFVWEVSMRACVCVCMSAPEAMNN